MPKRMAKYNAFYRRASISNMADEKAGVSARVVTLQDQPYPDNFDFTTLDKAFRENYGTLGVAFIKQYKSKRAYKSAFESYQRYFNQKVVMKSCNV